MLSDGFAPAITLQQKIAILQHRAAPAWFDQRGGVVLFDDRRTGEGEADRHRDTMINRRLHRRARTRHADRARRLLGIRAKRMVVAFVKVVAAASAVHRAQIDDSSGLLRRMAVDTVVQRQEVAI